MINRCKAIRDIEKNTETAILVATAIAGVVAGVYKSYDEVLKNIITHREKFFPNNNLKKIYDTCFIKYKKLYDSL